MSVEVSGLAGRYATALYDLADAGKVIDEVAADLASLGRMIDESEDLRRLVMSPVISRGEQTKAIRALVDKAGMQDLTQRFVGTVAQNRRLFVLRKMISAFHAYLAERRGQATAEVTSATELTDKQLSALNDALKGAMGTSVSVETKVDPSLLGGLVVKVGSRMIDTSLRTKLAQLRLAMKGT
ncbi:MAG: F0F1 ATP synthase subunit delta [Rhodospirillales bacterium]